MQRKTLVFCILILSCILSSCMKNEDARTRENLENFVSQNRNSTWTVTQQIYATDKFLLKQGDEVTYYENSIFYKSQWSYFQNIEIFIENTNKSFLEGDAFLVKFLSQKSFKLESDQKYNFVYCEEFFFFSEHTKSPFCGEKVINYYLNENTSVFEDEFGAFYLMERKTEKKKENLGEYIRSQRNSVWTVKDEIVISGQPRWGNKPEIEYNSELEFTENSIRLNEKIIPIVQIYSSYLTDSELYEETWNSFAHEGISFNDFHIRQETVYNESIKLAGHENNFGIYYYDENSAVVDFHGWYYKLERKN